jgi:hypothetical protein
MGINCVFLLLRETFSAPVCGEVCAETRIDLHVKYIYIYFLDFNLIWNVWNKKFREMSSVVLEFMTADGCSGEVA